jgi:hypothetical protein
VIFVRSRRPTLLLAAATSIVALALLAATVYVAVGSSLAEAVLLLLPTAFAIAFALRAGRRLRRWPAFCLGFFQDALVVVNRRHALRAGWAEIELITLASSNDWSLDAWPEVRLTDRLTIRLRDHRSIRLRPASFGLDPVACRDLVLRLRDDAAARAKLPEFDSDRDLAKGRIEVGELMKPRL